MSSGSIDESVYSKQQLLTILEDLRIEYTPYYIHYYHVLTAIDQEYTDKPKIREDLRQKVHDRLDSKLKEVHADIIKRYMIDSERVLHDWIKHYLDDPVVKRQVDLFNINNDKLFVKLEAPDFELEFPSTLTKEVYIQILKKVFAGIRHTIYKEIRGIIRPREEKYLTKNEVKDMLHRLNT